MVSQLQIRHGIQRKLPRKYKLKEITPYSPSRSCTPVSFVGLFALAGERQLSSKTSVKWNPKTNNPSTPGLSRIGKENPVKIHAMWLYSVKAGAPKLDPINK